MKGRDNLVRALVLCAVLIACLLVSWQVWRTSEISGGHLQALVERSVEDQVSRVAGLSPVHAPVEDFQWSKEGTTAKFTGKVAVERRFFRNLHPLFEPSGSSRFRMTGTALIQESSTSLMGLDLNRLGYMNPYIGFEIDDPRSPEERYEEAWKDEGKEAEWIYDLGINFENQGMTNPVPPVVQALSLRALRREKRLEHAIKVIGHNNYFEPEIWRERIFKEKEMMIAEMHRSPDWRTKFLPHLQNLGYISRDSGKPVVGIYQD